MRDKSDTPICPRCGSDDIAEIMFGLPRWSEELKRELEEGRIALGGCVITPYHADWKCNACEHEFGTLHDAYVNWRTHQDEVLRSIVYGAAVGDALGVPFEFMRRGTFNCTGMVGGGTHGMPAGTFSDDTSLMLATCDSMKEMGYFDDDDIRMRFRQWLYEGKYTPDGKVFDVGNSTATALEQGFGCSDEHSNGNGSLMRIAPLAVTSANFSIIKNVSSITHAHPWSIAACFIFVEVIRNVSVGLSLEDAIKRAFSDDAEYLPGMKEFTFLNNLADKTRDEIHSTGFVVHTLEAALWCVMNTKNYAECVLEAVNLGDDTDTTACVAGALAGAIYGYDAIPKEWIEQLRGKDVIDGCLDTGAV